MCFTVHAEDNILHSQDPTKIATIPDEQPKPFNYKKALLIVGGVIILAAVVYVWFLYETRVPTEIEPTLNDLNDIYQKGVSQIYEQSTKPFNET